MLIKRGTILIILICFFSSEIIAQETERRPLKELLRSLEKQFNIKFNYSVDTIDEVLVVPPSPKTNLGEIINHLRKNTGFRYKKIGAHIITISEMPDNICYGFLVDQSSNLPVPFAIITGGNLPVLTDANGYFEIPSTGFKKVSVLADGYKVTEYTINTDDLKSPITLSIRPEITELSAVVLSSYLVRGINKLKNGSLNIDFKKFSLLPGLVETDVLQSAQAFPGVQSIDETVSNINIRGGSNDQNLILWDDIKMYQSGHFFGLISVFNPQITREVNLINNGTSSRYTDGVSGTILMKTDDEINSDTKANFGVNFLSADLFADISLGKKSSLQVAGRGSLNSLAQTPTYRSYFTRISQDTEITSNMMDVINSDQSFNFYDTSLRWLYTMSPKDKLRVNFIAIANELAFDETASLEDEVITRKSSLTQNSIAGGIGYERQWTSTFETALHMYETDYTLRAVNANVLSNQRFLQENVVSETGLKLSNNYSFRENINFAVGYQFVETAITDLDDVDNPSIIIRTEDILRTHGLFLENTMSTLSRKFSSTFGIRYNYLDQLGLTLLEPRISISQEISKLVTVQALAETKHQTTSQIVNFQNDFLGIEKRRWQLSNGENIPVIKSRQASLGLNFKKKGWLVDAVGYVKQVDGITSQSQGFETKYEFISAIGSYQAVGADIIVRRRYNKFTSWLSYGFLDTDYTFDALEERIFPSNFDITHSLTLGSTFEQNKLKVSAGLNYRTGKPITRPLNFNTETSGPIIYDKANSSRLNDYWRLDTSLTYQVFKDEHMRVEGGVSILNILNQDNTISNFYRLDPQNQIQEFPQRSLRFTANAMIRLYIN